jgi:hypothetical protein
LALNRLATIGIRVLCRLFVHLGVRVEYVVGKVVDDGLVADMPSARGFSVGYQTRSRLSF